MILAASSVAFTFTLCMSSGTTPATCLQREAEHFARQLGVVRPIATTIRTVPPRRNALANQWAWARRTSNGTGCQLDFMPDAARDRETIAHEVCHCHHHWHAMTVSGATPATVTVRDLAEIEQQAESCAAELVRVR